MQTAAALSPIVVILLAFEGYCFVVLVRHEASTLPRWAWAVIVAVSIPFGGIVYLLVGRGRPVGPPPDEPRHVRSGIGAPAGTARVSTAGGMAVRVRRLRKVYGDRAALDDISLDVPSGSVFGMVGPNGAGKTTLLAILAGLRHPTAGEVELGVATDKVALLPDTPHFEPWLTAREVVDLARALTRPGTSASLTDRALDDAGLLDAADRRTAGFSRGMLQRLGLAATIVGEPELLLLDEPCSALDPLGRREVLDLIGRLGGRRTVLFCSHILDDVQEVCDAVGVLRDGHVLFQGSLHDLLVGRAAPEYAVRARPPLVSLIESLSAEPWVLSVEQVGAEELHVRVRSLDEAEQHLAAAVDRSHARLTSIVPAGADLERVFLELTR